jgi:hypothetical protein
LHPYSNRLHFDSRPAEFGPVHVFAPATFSGMVKMAAKNNLLFLWHIWTHLIHSLARMAHRPPCMVEWIADNFVL